MKTAPRTPRHSFGRRLLLALFAALVAVTTITTASVPAQALDCPPGSVVERYIISHDPITYGERCVQVGDDGDDGDDGDEDGGGGGELSCELESPYTFCKDDARCYYSDEWDDSWVEPQDPKPSEDAEAVLETCEYPPFPGPTVTRPAWRTEEPDIPSLPDQAIMAYGNLEAPLFDLVFNPSVQSYVGTDTYFWAEGVPVGEVSGTPAFTLVAVAVPSHLEIVPGDGSGSINCGWATSKTEDCVRTYVESSARHDTTDAEGRPSFTASATLVYDVEYRQGDTVLTNLGLPAEYYTLTSEATVQVPVGEVQVIVD